MVINIIKLVYTGLGFLFMGIGMLGIVLPLLPTTPLLLLALYFFARGSERFEKWFKKTNVYKKYLESFIQERAMTRKQKLTISLFADAMIAVPFFILDNLWIRLILLMVVVIKWYYFITQIKTIPPSKEGSVE